MAIEQEVPLPPATDSRATASQTKEMHVPRWSDTSVRSVLQNTWEGRRLLTNKYHVLTVAYVKTSNFVQRVTKY